MSILHSLSLSSLSLAFLLGGCMFDQAPIINTIDKKVDVIVKVPCKVTAPEKPVMPVSQLTKEDTIYKKTQTALAEIELRKGYETKLEAAVKACQ